MKNNICLLVMAVLVFFSGVSALAAGPNSLTLDNQSGENALVKLIIRISNGEETCATVTVPNGTSKTIKDLDSGDYYILVRYEKNSKFRYGKGDDFSINPPLGYYCKTSITLHGVAGGSYGIKDISAELFNSK